MTLEETHHEINQILGNNAEPLESVRLVETYRQYLKPETVRVVLLAESFLSQTGTSCPLGGEPKRLKTLD